MSEGRTGRSAQRKQFKFSWNATASAKAGTADAATLTDAERAYVVLGPRQRKASADQA